MAGQLEGLVTVLTGGAQGLGEALAMRLSREGSRVVIGDINESAAASVARRLPDAIAVGVDVTNFAQCEALAKAAVDRYGRIDRLIANAAIVLSGPVTELTGESFQRVLSVNLLGCFHTIKAVVPHMLKAGGGAIVQISSKSGKKGSARNSAYAASKFGGIGLVQSLALELAEQNIRVNAVCPGNLLDSPLWVNSLYDQYARNQGITPEQVREKYIQQVPMKRGCSYQDVENIAVFLLSDASSYMTGQAINVTGGQQMN